MGDGPITVVDTNVLLNLATPVVDGRSNAPTGGDPLKAVLSAYDVHCPALVVGEVSEATGGDDLLSAAADTVLKATNQITVHDLQDSVDEPLAYGLDPGESRGIRLANELGASMFVTDEFNTTNYLFVTLAIEDRNTVFTTPHVLCRLAEADVLSPEYVDAALTYFLETKHWAGQYLDRLRRKYLRT